MRLGVAVELGRVSAVALARGRIVWAAEAPFESDADLAAALGALAAERPRRASEARVLLADGMARCKEVRGLPAMRHSDLAAHVQLHSKRYFLQNGIPLVTDALPPLRRSHEGALLASAPIPLIDAVVSGLEAAGLRCAGIAPARALVAEQSSGTADDAGRFALAAWAAVNQERLSLLPAGLRRQRAKANRSVTLRLAAAAAGVWLMAAAAWLVDLRRGEQAALAELQRLREPLAVAMAERQDLARVTEGLALLAAGGREGWPATALLASLARGLPDQAFLSSIRLDATGGSISGHAPRASAVVSRLERQAGLGGVRLEGPVTREVVGGREYERFIVRFQLRSESR